MRFTAGDFSKLGKIYQIKTTATADASGRVDDTNEDNWRLIGPRHFHIVPVSSKEYLLGDQVNTNLTHQITTTYDRRSKAFNEQNKFVYNGRTFTFAGPGTNVEERNRWISFPANEI